MGHDTVKVRTENNGSLQIFDGFFHIALSHIGTGFAVPGVGIIGFVPQGFVEAVDRISWSIELSQHQPPVVPGIVAALLQGEGSIQAGEGILVTP